MGSSTDKTIRVLVATADQGAEWTSHLGDDAAVQVASTAAEAQTALATGEIDALVCDDRVVGPDGEALLVWAAREWPEVVRILIAAPDAVATAAAFRAVNQAGVLGFVSRPVDPELLRPLLDRTAAVLRSRRETAETIAELRAALDRMTAEVRRAERASVAAQASIDLETDLWDRQHLVERLEDEGNRVTRYGIPYGVILVELRAPVGGLELASADLLQEFVRRVDVCARFEPNCFAVVCPSTDDAGMRRLAVRVLGAFTEADLPGSPAGHVPDLTIATVAVTSGPCPTDEVLARLQTARRTAREGGGIAHWEPET